MILMSTRGDKVGEIGQSFQTFITKLEKNQVEYDLGSENIIKDRGSVKNGKFVIGKCSYSTVVIPPMTENIDFETYKLLMRFVSNGGRLIAFSLPSLVNGAPSEGLNDFLSWGRNRIIKEQDLGPESINKYFAVKNISFSDCSGGDLYHHRRVMSDGQILFMTNSSLKESFKGTVKIEGADAAEMNTLTGEINSYPSVRDGENLKLTIELPPAGSLLLLYSWYKTGTFTPTPVTKEY